ncbi:MAG: hypothetical protein IH983_10300 [Planctomycetes bacterium]|nr:hypothetical protein [Planctomycetota bacterium]
MASIKDTLPFRNEVIDVFIALSQYATDDGTSDVVRRFLERLLPLGYWPKESGSWIKGQADNFAFLNQELFLYCLAAFLKFDRFETVNDLLVREFYLPPVSNEVQANMVSYSQFNADFPAINRNNQRQKPRWLSPAGALMKERAKRTDIRFDDLMQADFILFIRSLLHGGRWWPDTLVYASHHYDCAFEVFARSQSSTYFNRAKIALGVAETAELQTLIRSMTEGSIQLPRWEHETFDPAVLSNIKRIATQP